MAKPTWLGRNEMESRQESRNASLPSFSAFFIFKPWNEESLMRNAGMQECFALIFSCLPAFLIQIIQCGW
jgi:hypothetical protein